MNSVWQWKDMLKIKAEKENLSWENNDSGRHLRKLSEKTDFFSSGKYKGGFLCEALMAEVLTQMSIVFLLSGSCSKCQATAALRESQ